MNGLKIIGKIELPEKKIRPQEYRRLLEDKLSRRSQEINEQLGVEFLDNQGAIKIPAGEAGARDRQFVDDLESDWATRSYKTVEEWRETKAKNPSTIAEMAVTLSLSRQLGERFIVARASSYDDYKYGVDNLLIDKITGATVCGFDDVLGFTGDDGGSKKQQKMEKALAAGGSTVKYGATVENGQLKRKSLANLPTFYLSLSKEELDGLLADLKAGGEVTAREKEVASKLINSLTEQREKADQIAKAAPLQENLNRFDASLAVMRQLINQ